MNKKLMIFVAIIVALGFFGVQWSVADAQGTIPPIPVTGTGVSGQIPVTGIGPIIDAGFGHSCMVISRGVFCWGLNYSGQVGDGTNIDRHTAVYVKDIGSVSTISLGSYHSCALLSDGTVWCWGENGQGQLGIGTTEDSNVPVQVLGLPSDAVAITAGQNFTCAVLADKSVWCWGQNNAGQLNDGTTTNQLTAVKSIYGAAPAQISGGQTVVVGEASGYVSLWNKSEPTNVTGLSNAINISGNRFATGGCAVTEENKVDCWANADSPVAVEDSDKADLVIAGLTHGCAMDLDSKVMCWGTNIYGELGDGTNIDNEKANYVSNLGSVADFGVGANHNCVILSETDIRCWGWNAFGQLGNDTQTNSSLPVKVILP